MALHLVWRIYYFLITLKRDINFVVLDTMRLVVESKDTIARNTVEVSKSVWIDGLLMPQVQTLMIPKYPEFQESQ
jgi:hypothetical protein